MNISSGDDLFVSGFSRERRDDAMSIAKSLASVSMASSSDSLLSKSDDNGGSTHATSSVVAMQEGPIEVDFYRNPTILSRMILYNKFANAQKRCRDHPWEASVWVCAKRKSNVGQAPPIYGMFDRNKSTRSTDSGSVREQTGDGGYSLRQLPIHIACTSLAFAHDATSRSDLEQLIVRLVVTYPEGCGEFDHGGKLPLHEAIWSNASPETTAMLLMASPHSIEQRDKFGRTPIELNSRRTGKNRDEIADMLNLGVHYWDQARQEAKLRMKLAVPLAPGAKSINSQSVLGTSEMDKETIYTTNSVLLPARPQPHAPKIESEEIIPIAWEQLERRVLLLEQLLAEMYEKNYELAGLVEELKKAKHVLRQELEAARASAMQQHSLVAVKGRAHRSSSASCPSVKVVPEDDEMSSVKLVEQAERIEQLESLVDSYYSSKRKRSNTGSSRISELSSVSSYTNDGAGVRGDTNLARQDSLVSGLTVSDASFFDTSIHAVKNTHVPEEDGDDTIPLDDPTGPVVTQALGTDNLKDMFDKAAEFRGSGKAEPSGRKEWAWPVPTTSFLPANNAKQMPPISVREDEKVPVGETGPNQPPTTTHASEIYFPGYRSESSPPRDYSPLTASMSASHNAMSESSTIVSDENEVFYAIGRSSLGSFDELDMYGEEETSEATKSTRARLEDMVFGCAPANEGDESGRRPQRFNYDIQIPALDTFHASDGNGES